MRPYVRTAAAVVSKRTRKGARRPSRFSTVPESLESRTLMAAVTDNFDDGDEVGWVHYSPLAGLGAPGSYEVVDGMYHITAPESPAPEQAGPGRAGSFRPDATYTDFTASIDLVDWDSGLNQAFGILARVATPGLGSTNGYALSYSTNGDLDISLVTGEVPDDLDPSVDIFLTAGNDYRLVFQGRGPRLYGALYDLADPATPIARTQAFDRTYTSGMTGVFVYANTSDGSGTADATFDNFSANDLPAGPAPLGTVAYWRFEEGTAGQDFPPPTDDGGPDSGLAVDSAGGNDPLRTFSGGTNPVYTADKAPGLLIVGGDIVVPNNLALDFTPNEDLYTAGAGDLNAHVFDQFTVEVSFNLDTGDLWQNLVGKDGKPTSRTIAPLQFKRRVDTGNLQIEILDAGGNARQVQTLSPVEPGRWYHAAAVNDGTTLKLYLDDTTDAEGYVLQGSVDVSGGLYDSDATWTVGRGYFDGNITDWTDGRIDEVRISDVAVAPNNFLFGPGEGFGAAAVTQVFVNGQNLASNAAFRGAAGIDPTFGYPIPAGTDQLRSLPWVNGVNAVSLRFNQDVTGRIDQGDLVLHGVNTANYTLSSFTYDAATRTATWTLGTPVTNDKLRLILDDATVSGLDGEWANGADTYPSGNNTPGGDFDFRINVLRGDATGDGTVNALDLADVRRRLGRRPGDGTTGAGAYSIFSDITMDGVVNALDLAAVRQRLGNRLPVGEPV